MAKAYQQKARKEYKCGKCGATINKGDLYYKIEAMYTPTKYRCCHCKPERSELTSSEYYSWLYNLQDHLNELYDLRSDGVIEDIVSELEDIKSELEEKLENMPEQLQDAEAGSLLQERIQSLEDAINELDYIEYPDYDSVVDDANIDEEDLEEDEIEAEKERVYEEALDEYEEQISEIIQNIE